MSTSPERRALVVGAGIAGLAAALRLRRSGWSVRVVERAPRLRGGGYMIGFLGIGYDAAERLGLIGELERMQPEPAELVYVDQGGRPQAVLPTESQLSLLGPRTLALLRGDLETVLHNAVDDLVEICFGTTVENVAQDDDGVWVRLGDGRQERVDLLVAADGLHSGVRKLVFGPEQRFRVDFDHAVATYLLDQAPAVIPAGTTMSMDLVGRSVGVYRLRDGRAAAFFSFHSNDMDAEVTAGPAATLRARFGDLGWVVPELLAGLDSAESVYFDRISQIRMDSWSRGRVVLLGDAAWCVSLFAGYGSSLAVGGADLLGDALDATPADIPGALRSWEQRLRPTVLRKQRQGRRARALFVIPNALVLRLRLVVFRLSATPLVLALTRRFLGLTTRARTAR